MQLKSASISLLCDLWDLYSSVVENQLWFFNTILTILKKTVRESPFSLKLAALTHLFHLLDTLASQKSPFASIIYKSLTFALIEHYENTNLRQYILTNFSQTFQKFTNIPLDILLGPLLRQLHGLKDLSIAINSCDFQFLEIMVSHPNLNITYAILLLDLLSKVYLNSVCFAPLAGSLYLIIIQRFIEEPAMQDYLIEFTKLALSNYYNSVKDQQTKASLVQKNGHHRGRSQASAGVTAEKEAKLSQQIIESQKRALIISILRDIICFQCNRLNINCKVLLVYTSSQIRKLTHHDNKGILYLLSIVQENLQIQIEINEQEALSELNPNENFDGTSWPEFYASRQATSPGNSILTRKKDESFSYFESPKEQKRSGSTGGYTRLTVKEKLPLRNMQRKDGNISFHEVREEIEQEKPKAPGQGVWSDKKSSEGMMHHRNRKIKGLRITEDEFKAEREIMNSTLIGGLDGDEDESISRILEENDIRPTGYGVGYRDKNEEKLKKQQVASIKLSNIVKAANSGEIFIDSKAEVKGILQELVLSRQEKSVKQEESVSFVLDREDVIGKKPADSMKLVKRISVDTQKSEKRTARTSSTEAKQSSLIKQMHRKLAPSLQKQENVESIVLVNLDLEEDFQREEVLLYIKQNTTKFKYLFTKYSREKSTNQNKKTFEQLLVQYNTVNQLSIMKMIKEHTLNSMVTKEEITQLFKLVNNSLLAKDELQPLNFDSFVKFLVQLAIHIFNKSPLDLENILYVECIRKLIFVMDLAIKIKQDYQHLHKEDAQNNGADGMVGSRLLDNENQSNDISSPLAEIRKNIVENIAYKHTLPDSLKVAKSYRVAYEILDDLLNKHFGFHITELKAIVTANQQNIPQRRTKMTNPPVTRGRRNISADVTKETQKKRMNLAEEERLKRLEEEKEKKEALDKKIEKRKEELEERMRVISDIKRGKEWQKKKEDEREKMLDEKLEALKQELKQKELEEKAKKVQEYKESLFLECLLKEDLIKQKEARIAELKERRELTHMHNGHSRNNIDSPTKLEDKKSNGKGTGKTLNLKPLGQNQKEGRMETSGGETEAYESLGPMDGRGLIIASHDLHQSRLFQAYYKKNQKKLSCIFEHYKKLSNKGGLSIKGFMSFGDQFNIIPDLILYENYRKVFYSIVQGRKGEPELSYDDFLQALLKLSMISEGALKVEEEAQIGKAPVLDSTIKKDKASNVKEGNKKEVEVKNTYEEQRMLEEYQRVQETTLKRLEKLIKFLNLPREQKELNNKLELLSRGNRRVKPAQRSLSRGRVKEVEPVKRALSTQQERNTEEDKFKARNSGKR